VTPSDVTCIEGIAGLVSFALFIVLVVVPLFDIRKLLRAILGQLRNEPRPLSEPTLKTQLPAKTRIAILLAVLVGIVLMWMIGGR
jgi:hypothetical protein